LVSEIPQGGFLLDELEKVPYFSLLPPNPDKPEPNL
jgi:hypothetical protein